MDTIGSIASVVTALAAVIALSIAVVQVRNARADAHDERVASLSWNVYEAYNVKELRDGRGVLHKISRTPPIPRSGREFGEMYRTASYCGDDAEKVLQRARDLGDFSLRPILRYYQQVGVLIEKNLVDADFIFPLIGDNLKTSEIGIRLAVEWYQNYYGGHSGTEEAPRRNVYGKALLLLDMHQRWSSERSFD